MVLSEVVEVYVEASVTRRVSLLFESSPPVHKGGVWTLLCGCELNIN